ncbi:DUF6879 family protein [Nonomuraea sp. NPDC050663]|uniref:DUF6879 family protein n=1 Tax=Nonomuraea sp. NPDC050663 TaxID=3364370 RepID=UPI0037BB7DE4
MLDRIRQAPGEAMNAADYGADFDREFAAHRGIVWKLERLQHFDEGDFPSFTAAMAGDWDRAWELMEEYRPHFAASFPEGIDFRRVRVVEEPWTPYMRWELPWLVARGEAGETCRVVPTGLVAAYEHEQPVPELVLIHSGLLYQVLYDEGALHTGCRRITDPSVVEPTRDVLAALFEQGEDLRSYVERA